MSNQFNFIETKEYLKFVEFCDSCAEYKYIGICHGLPGVGKTAAARYYTNWDRIEHSIKNLPYDSGRRKVNLPSDILDTKTLFITSPTVRPNTVYNTLNSYAQNLKWAKEVLFCQLNNLTEEEEDNSFNECLKKEIYEGVELVIVDEVDRLKTQTIEILRDIWINVNKVDTKRANT